MRIAEIRKAICRYTKNLDTSALTGTEALRGLREASAIKNAAAIAEALPKPPKSRSPLPARVRHRRALARRRRERARAGPANMEPMQEVAEKLARVLTGPGDALADDQGRERPFSKADIKRFGTETPPAGAILAVRVEDLDEKKAVLAAGTSGIFTISHFDSYPAVLIQLGAVSKKALREVVTDAWLACAPPGLAKDYLTKKRR